MHKLIELPLGGEDANYNSRKSRQALLNLLAEASADGTYRTVKDTPGLTEVADLSASGAIRSNLFVNSGFMYVVAGGALYRLDQFLTPTLLGTVNGSGRARIRANSVPGDNQVLTLNGIGQGFVYTNGGGLVQITDPDFFSTVAATVLGERGWFVRQDTNEFFGSDISNFLAYNPLTFASGEFNPDNIVQIVAKKSALWLLQERSLEYWQTINDPTLPVRAVIGASKERGIAAVDSLADAGEIFCWFADDNTVRMIEGTSMRKISGLDFELLVRGDGTPEFPGFSVTDDAIGFFIDGPVHKTYYLTFPTEGYTWAYDFSTGLEHQRASGPTGEGVWRVGCATLFNNKLYAGDLFTGQIYELDQGAKTENGEIMRRSITTPSISADADFTVPELELTMEVGQTTDPVADPVMMVEYSKDGGYTWRQHKDVKLGKFGNYRAKVRMRQFGRVVRGQDLILRFTVTDPVRVQFYALKGVLEVDGG